MKNKVWVGLAVVMGAALLLASMPQIVRAEDMPPPEAGMIEGKGKMKDMKKHMEEMDNKLGLSDEQRAQMKALREEGRAAMQAARTALKAKHEALKQELDSEKPDRARAEVIVKELGALEQQVAMGRVDQVLKMRAVLTPEQYKKLCEFRAQKKGEFKGKRKHGRHQGKDDVPSAK